MKRLTPQQLHHIDKAIDDLFLFKSGAEKVLSAHVSPAELEAVIRQDEHGYTAGVRTPDGEFIELFTFELPISLADFASLCKQVDRRVKQASKK